MYLASRRAPTRRSPLARRRRSRRRRAFIRGDGAGAARGPRGQAPRTGARTRRADGGHDAVPEPRAPGQPCDAAAAAAPSRPRRGRPRPRRRPPPFPAPRTASVIARDHIRLVRRAAAAAGWRTHPAGAPLVRRRPRAVRAAPPPPPQTRPVPSASGPIQRLPRMPRSMTAARRREAASRKHNKLAAPLPPPPPRRFGQELVETSDLSVRRPYSELAPCRAARGELRGQSAPSAASGCVALETSRKRSTYTRESVMGAGGSYHT